MKRLFAYEPFVPAYLSIAIGLALLFESDSNHRTPAWTGPKSLFDTFTPHPLRVWGLMYLIGGILAIFPFAKLRLTQHYAPLIRIIAYAGGAATYIGYGATLLALAIRDPKVSVIGSFIFLAVGLRFYYAAGKVGEDRSVWPQETDEN